MKIIATGSTEVRRGSFEGNDSGHAVSVGRHHPFSIAREIGAIADRTGLDVMDLIAGVEVPHTKIAGIAE